MTLAERRSRLEAARVLLDGFESVLHEASGAELGEVMAQADRLAARAGAARVVVTVEAVRRGEVAASGLNTHAWVRGHAPSLCQGGAGDVAKIASEVTGGAARGISVDPADAGAPAPGSASGIVWAGVVDASVLCRRVWRWRCCVRWSGSSRTCWRRPRAR